MLNTCLTKNLILAFLASRRRWAWPQNSGGNLGVVGKNWIDIDWDKVRHGGMYLHLHLHVRKLRPCRSNPLWPLTVCVCHSQIAYLQKLGLVPWYERS